MPNIGRNCIINVAETVVYDSVKDGFISNGIFKDGFSCHLSSAAVAGVCATIVASPVDVVKTRWVQGNSLEINMFHCRYMNADIGRYRGALHCASITFRTEGARLVSISHTFLSPFTQVQLRKEEQAGSLSGPTFFLQQSTLQGVLQGLQCLLHETGQLEHLPLADL